MNAYVQLVTDFIAQHPNWASLVAFLVAASEAIAFVGTFVPGTVILIAIGTAIGLGHLPLWPILILATLGAIAGDGISFWFGHRYGQHIAKMWPFSRRPGLLAQGEAYFLRHGAKSVVVGRFLPVMRAVVPVAAGILGMSPMRFYVANIASAIAWALLHILPGVLFGGLMSVIGGISGRLVVALGTFVVLAVSAVWLLRLLIVRAPPMLARLQAAIAIRTRGKSGTLPRLIGRILDPDDAGARTILLFGTILLICGIGFFNILEDVVTRDTMVLADASISHFIQMFRTAWTDRLMVVVTMFGDTIVSAAVTVATVAWLAWHRQWRLAAGFVLTMALATFAVFALKQTLHLARPIDVSAVVGEFSFPSGHATISATLYGMLAWLASRGMTNRIRFAPVFVAGCLIGAIAASRLYLAAHWPSDVAAGALLGFGLVAIFALAYRHVEPRQLRPVGLFSVALVTMLGVGAWHTDRGFTASFAAYAPQRVTTAITEAAWRADGWRRLSKSRIDLGGETEGQFILQWAGPANALKESLAASGWTSPARWSVQNIAAFGRQEAQASSLPVLPLLHNGRTPTITMIKPEQDEQRRWVLRAWRSDFEIEYAQGARPILLVSLSEERIAHPWNLGSVPISVSRSNMNLATSLLPESTAHWTHLFPTVGSALVP